MNWKSLLKKVAIGVMIPIVLATFAGAGYGAWYFLLRPTPTKTLKKAISFARQRNADQFRGQFSSPSVRALEGSWSGDAFGSGGSWRSMMTGLLENNGAPPEIMEEEINEANTRARVKIRLEGEPRFVSLIRDESDPAWLRLLKDGGDWRIDVLSGINEGLSEEARLAQADARNEAKADDKAKEGGGDDFTLEPPKEEGWWKSEEK